MTWFDDYVKDWENNNAPPPPDEGDGGDGDDGGGGSQDQGPLNVEQANQRAGFEPGQDVDWQQPIQTPEEQGPSEAMAREAFGIPWTDQWDDWTAPPTEPSGNGPGERDQGSGWAELRDQYIAANIGAGGTPPPWKWGSWFDTTRPDDMLPNGLPAGARPPANPYEAAFYQNNLPIGNGSFGPPTVLVPPRLGSDTYTLEQGLGNNKISIPLPEIVQGTFHPNPDRYRLRGGIEPMTWEEYQRQQRVRDLQQELGAPALPFDRARQLAELRELQELGYDVGFHPNPERFLPEGGTKGGVSLLDAGNRFLEYRQVWPLLYGATVEAREVNSKALQSLSKEDQDLIALGPYPTEFGPQLDDETIKKLTAAQTRLNEKVKELQAADTRTWVERVKNQHEIYERDVPQWLRRMLEHVDPGVVGTNLMIGAVSPGMGEFMEYLPFMLEGFDDLRSLGKKTEKSEPTEHIPHAEAMHRGTQPLLQTLRAAQPKPQTLWATQPLQQTMQIDPFTRQRVAKPAPPAKAEEQTAKQQAFTTPSMAALDGLLSAPPAVASAPAPMLPYTGPSMQKQTAIAAPELKDLSTAGRLAAGEILQSHGFAPTGGVYQLTTPQRPYIAPEELSRLPLRDQQVLANILIRKGWMGR